MRVVFGLSVMDQRVFRTVMRAAVMQSYLRDFLVGPFARNQHSAVTYDD